MTKNLYILYTDFVPYTTYFPANVDLEFDTIGHSLMGMDVLLGGKIDEKLYDISVRDFNSSEALTKLGTSQTYSLDVLNTKMQYTAVNKLDWYVEVGTVTEGFTIDKIRVGQNIFQSTDDFTLSIGNNNFIKDKVFKQASGDDKLYVAAPVLSSLMSFVFEDDLETSSLENGNFVVYNTASGKSADAFLMPWSIMDDSGMIAEINEVTIAPDGGAVTMDTTASATENMPVYNVALKNGQTPLYFESDDIKSGDLVINRITETINGGTPVVRYAFDSIDASGYWGYAAGWIEDEDWADFDNVTRVHEVMIRDLETGGIKMFNYKTVATKYFTTQSNISTSTVMDTLYSQVYNSVENTTTGAQYVNLSDIESVKDSYLVQVGTLAEGVISVNEVKFAKSNNTGGYTTVATFGSTGSGTAHHLLGIGNNSFIDAVAFEVEDGNLMVQAPLVEAMANVCDLIIIDGAVCPFNVASTQGTTKLTKSDNTQIGAGNIAEDESNDTYTITVTEENKNSYIAFDYTDARAGDKILVVEFDVDAEGNKTYNRSGIDAYTTEHKVFFYPAYGANLEVMQARTRHFVVITPQGVAELTLVVQPQTSAGGGA